MLECLQVCGGCGQKDSIDCEASEIGVAAARSHQVVIEIVSSDLEPTFYETCLVHGRGKGALRMYRASVTSGLSMYRDVN